MREGPTGPLVLTGPVGWDPRGATGPEWYAQDLAARRAAEGVASTEDRIAALERRVALLERAAADRGVR